MVREGMMNIVDRFSALENERNGEANLDDIFGAMMDGLKESLKDDQEIRDISTAAFPNDTPEMALEKALVCYYFAVIAGLNESIDKRYDEPLESMLKKFGDVTERMRRAE